jgi:hypothetical protein
MIYKIVMSTGEGIMLENEEAFQKFLAQIQQPNQRFVLTRHGLVNVNYVVSIVEHKEKMKEATALLSTGRTRDEALKEVIGESSFVKFEGMKKLETKN